MSFGVGRPLDVLGPAAHHWLWLIAVLFFGVGDVATTVVGLDVPGITEGNPVARPIVFQFGLPGMVALKAFTFGIAVGIWWATPSPYATGVPFGLAALGVVLTAWNLLVVSIAVF